MVYLCYSLGHITLSLTSHFIHSCPRSVIASSFCVTGMFSASSIFTSSGTGSCFNLWNMIPRKYNSTEALILKLLIHCTCKYFCNCIKENLILKQVCICFFNRVYQESTSENIILWRYWFDMNVGQTDEHEFVCFQGIY